MRQKSILILGIVMGLLFTSLIGIETLFVRQMVEIRQDQFDAAVKSALSQTSQSLEEQETLEYIDSEMKFATLPAGDDQDTLPPNLDQLRISLRRDSQMATRQRPVVFISTKHGVNTLEETSRTIQNRLRERYLRERAELDNILIRMLLDTNTKDIKDRVPVKKLKRTLLRELDFNGINEDFYFSINDKEGQEIYNSHKEGGPKASEYYTQILYPSDPTPQASYLKLYFPHKKSPLHQVLTLLIPFAVLTLLMLAMFILTLWIISRQKKLSEMRNDFIHNMTHELKTPVASISLASQMLDDTSIEKTPKAMAHIARVIGDETKRLSQQIEKVLQISLLEHESTMLRPKELDMNELCLNVAQNFALKVEAEGGRLEAELEAEDPFVMGDEVHLTNIVYSLMDNALKYKGADAPLIKVSTWNQEGRVCFAIADNGIGIAKENQKHIFEKFFRVHTGSVHDVKGFGLGLAYVKKVVRDHKGTIDVSSQLGRGTTFRISLPLKEEEKEQQNKDR